MKYQFPSIELLDGTRAETKFTDREYVKALAEELAAAY